MAHLMRPAVISGVSAGSFPEKAAVDRAYGKSVYNQKLIAKGIIRISDLSSEVNRFITTSNLNESGFVTIIDVIPCKWRETLRSISYVDKSNFVLQNEIQLKLLGVRISVRPCL